ncbi:MAG: hypothetical protein RLY86_4008 [Pseudomonadota bacterium]|jgi:DNA-binding NarL/FixJ family response regulator
MCLPASATKNDATKRRLSCTATLNRVDTLFHIITLYAAFTGLTFDGMHSIIIASGYPLFVEGMVILLKDILGTEVRIGMVDHAGAVPAALKSGQSDFLIIDLALGGFDLESDLPPLKRLYPRLAVLLVGCRAGAVDADRAALAGADVLLPPSIGRAGLEEAIAAIRAGRPYRSTGPTPFPAAQTAGTGTSSHRTNPRPPAPQGLTPRQSEVLAGIARGLSNREIGGRLGMTEGTVKNHVKAVMRVLKVSNRTQAAMIARSLLREGD